MQQLHTTPDSPELNVTKLFNTCWRRWRVFASVVAVGTVSTMLLLLTLLPRYTATATAIYHPSAGEIIQAPNAVNPAGSETLVDTEISRLTTHEYLQRVIATVESAAAAKQPAAKLPAGAVTGTEPSLTLLELQRGLSVTQVGRSPIISVSFTSRDPERAARIANRVVQLYIDEETQQLLVTAHQNLKRFEELNPGQPIDAGKITANLERLRAEGGYDTSLAFLSHASPPDRPSSPNLLLLGGLALLGFAIAGALLAVLLDRLDRGLRSMQQVSDLLGVPCIGLIPQINGLTTDRPHQYLSKAPYSSYAESIRSLTATALEMGSRDAGPQSILVTSSVPSEGKTTIAVSLAAYAARIGRRVLLLDLDTRQPATLRELAGRPDADALNQLLAGGPVGSIAQYLPELDFQYVPSPNGTWWQPRQIQIRQAAHLLFSYCGRISRRQFWLGFLLNIGLAVAVLAIGAAFVPWSSVVLDAPGGPATAGLGGLPPIDFTNAKLAPGYAGLALATLLGMTMTFALAVKRCHDLNKTGLWTLPILIPVVGAFWWFVELGLPQGSMGSNQHGPDPQGPQLPDVDLVALLADDRMGQLLERLRKDYDLVIIDGPPALAVTETHLLASLVDKVLFTVRWGTTRSDVAYNALRGLDENNLPDRAFESRVNAVVTRVDIGKHIKYGFGDPLEFQVSGPRPEVYAFEPQIAGAVPTEDPAAQPRHNSHPETVKV